MSKLSIVVPVYYNSDTLEMLYDDMKEKILHKLPEYEIVFVDDGSGDNSWEIMNKIAQKDENVVCTRLSRNFGEHAAILAGLSVCTGDCAVTKQADLQEDSTLILDLFEKWKEGYKVVLAIRSERDEGAMKKFFAGMYYWLVRKTINKDMPQGGCDCYLLDRQAIEVIEMLDEKNSSLTLQVMWIGFKSAKVYFHRKDRTVGKSRWTFAKKFKLVMDSMMSFSYFPIRVMSMCGVLFAILAFVGIISAIYEKLTTGTPILGYASLMCVILFASGVIMLTLGILGEYIWRVLEESRKRPPFIIDEVRKNDNK
ncbi:glycosyltransferase family 2 protein [Butyrivibrio sp. WCD3002]|uniref:glycosyltransferase family 2 protein n=1 Tax=Butyrivibrio sp. WCD3002 TaxID=1280676 RepID=UPI000420491B|nr:glycosyltransferase family 2 protein [Butyrivibrio sp. WCD3002]